MKKKRFFIICFLINCLSSRLLLFVPHIIFFYTICAKAQTEVPFKISLKNISQNKLNPILFSEIYQTEQDLDIVSLDSLVKLKKISLAKQKVSQGFSENVFWVQFKLDWANVNRSYLLEVDNPHIDKIVLYKKNENQFDEIGFGGDRNLKFTDRTYNNRRYIFPLKNTGILTTYYLMIDKRNASVSFPLWLWDKDAFEIKEDKQNIYFGIFFGIILFLGFIALVIYVFIKNKLFLYYAVYTLSMGLYLFTALGFSFQYLYPNSENVNNYSRIILSIIIAIFSTLFLRRFLNIDKNAPQISKFYKIVNIVLIMLSLAWMLFSKLFQVYSIWLLNVSNFLFLSIFLTSFFAAYLALKDNKFNAVVFFMAFSNMIVGSLAYLGIEYGFLNEDIFPLHPILLGFGFEIIILSIAMIYQLNKIIKVKGDLEIKNLALRDKTQKLINTTEALKKKQSEKKRHTIILKSKAVLNTAEILYIKSDGHYAEILLKGKEKPEIERTSLTNILELLPKQDFVRIHKSYVVNIHKIKIINATEVMLDNGEWIKLSRTYKHLLKDVLNNNS